MKCPNAEKGFCPSKHDMNEHMNEWWREVYCTTCGYEGKEKFDTPQKVQRDIPPPSPRRKKTTSTQQY